MSKTLEKLIQKAEKNGVAILNGRMRDYNYVGHLEEKYAIEIENNILELRHWGTVTLKLDLTKKEVLHWYGESNSDRDSMNFVLRYYSFSGGFRFRPSINEFSYTA